MYFSGMSNLGFCRCSAVRAVVTYEKFVPVGGGACEKLVKGVTPSPFFEFGLVGWFVFSRMNISY